MVVSWFSAGVSSAISTQIAIKKYHNIEILYIGVEDQHNDTHRFIKDCEAYYKTHIQTITSELKNVENACVKSGFVNSPFGASCTRLLKKKVRLDWEALHKNESITYVWGLDAGEKKRANRIKKSMPNFNHYFPLIEKGIEKREAHRILETMRIKRPVMYDLGYSNNNCIGCIKGGMGYWNKIRVDFPEVFKKRCKMERLIGGKVFKNFYLDELDPNKGRMSKEIIPEYKLF